MKYELTLVLSGSAKETKKKLLKETVEKLVGTLDGKVNKSDDWGKMDLAYKIRKESSGIFLYFELEFKKETSFNALLAKFKMDGDIIRYLLLRKE
ncbi:30S ribosomal protein S6 [Candidatus Woesebacteria bacterium RIFCSPHIGHO2_01_FULL_38_9b]|uniref:Small ribosomal subunit protein bS6 n=1 Tax=Candidatus Woesebacteria bacterium RIFCSPHIGHO2_01_FULL_38_9b TaxID=1802493 RepID=A0A1F7Y268_9BACT|nr:MAG: 30S ribosomal protein S6 [Candidatus Woesebacteria bacterium RIFCSPHIGHO2_01_FULL_38_9b]